MILSPSSQGNLGKKMENLEIGYYLFSLLSSFSNIKFGQVYK